MFRILILSLALALSILSAACAAPATPISEPTTVLTAAPSAAPPTASTTLTATPEPEPYPLTQTDALNRDVTINAKPKRIVSLAPSVTEILFAIGAGPQVVGRTEFCNYPPEATSLPTIGGFSAKSISVEAILDLQPDLVIAGSKRQKDVIGALEGAGITVFALAPNSLAEIESGILTLGEITGNAEEAETVVADMQHRVLAITQKIGSIPPAKRLRVFYEVFDEPLTTTTDTTFIGELITLAGGVNIFAELPEAYPNVSVEQIAELDPQIIIGPSSHADKLTAELIAARPGWKTLTAVKNEAVYIVDGDAISRAGPRVVDALEALVEVLYPDLFSR